MVKSLNLYQRQNFRIKPASSFGMAGFSLSLGTNKSVLASYERKRKKASKRS